jgi:SPX domain protein involved in polyphosphate accumulation
MRFERKYRIEDLTLTEVRQLFLMHPVSFRTLHPDRQINNIYFDTPDLLTYRQNMAGVGYRKKYRVRWYGADPKQVRKPKFEIKIKQNELGKKETHKLEEFSLVNLTEVTREVNRLNPDGNLLKPVLLNSYERLYLISSDGKFRVTIDHRMHYHSMLHHPHFTRYYHGDPAIIVEVKYKADTDDLLNQITQYLPFRQTKHSKYITGVELTN